jgi:hypothetical protein
MPNWKKVITSGSDAALNSLFAPSITGSLLGTASYATQALSSSYAVTSSLPLLGIVTASSNMNQITFTKGDGSSFNILLSTGSVASASYSATASYVLPLIQDVIITGSLNITGSIYNPDSIYFNTTASAPTTVGQLAWDDGYGTLDLVLKGGLVDVELGQENVVLVFNGEATTLNKGEVVFVSGSQGNRPAVNRALGTTDGYSATTLGFAAEPIAPGEEGYVTTFGFINEIDTSGTIGGSPVWLSPTVPGGWTTTKPQAPQHTVLLGYIVRVSNTVGSIFVQISNGWELGELHDVRETTTTASFGDLLVKSGSVWTNSRQLTGSYGLTGSLTATSFTGSLFGTASQALTASYVPTGVGGIYGGNGTVPLNTTASINGDFTFLGLDEDTRLIVRDGNNGGQIHLFSDGALGQSALEFYNPTGTSLLHRIQQAGGETRYISNTRNLVFSVSTGSSTQGIFITASNGDVGIGTTSPSAKLDISGSAIITGSLTVTSGITGSLFGTSSWAENAVTASFASTASYVNPLIQNVLITGSLSVSGSTTFNGPITTKTTRITSSIYTASVADYRIGIRYTDTGSVSIQLPLISSVGQLEYRFKDEEGNSTVNAITLVASGSNLIDGSATAILRRNYISIGLYNDGVSNWYIE